MSQAESQQSESCSYQSLDDTFTLAYDNNNIEDPLSPFSSARAPKHKKKPTCNNWYQSHLNLVLVKWIAISFIVSPHSPEEWRRVWWRIILPRPGPIRHWWKWIMNWARASLVWWWRGVLIDMTLPLLLIHCHNVGIINNHNRCLWLSVPVQYYDHNYCYRCFCVVTRFHMVCHVCDLTIRSSSIHIILYADMHKHAYILSVPVLSTKPRNWPSQQ